MKFCRENCFLLKMKKQIIIKVYGMVKDTVHFLLIAK